MKKLLALFLAVVMICGAGISCFAAEQPSYNYDNSLLIVAVLSGKTPAEVFTSEKGVSSLMVTYKEPTEGDAVKYQLLAMISDEFDKVKAALSDIEGVQTVERNYFAEDWYKREINVRLSTDHLYVPVGETRSMTYTTDREFLKNGLLPMGVEITVDPAVFDIAAADEAALKQMAIPNFFPVEFGFGFQGEFPYKAFWFNNEIKKGQAGESNRYVIIPESSGKIVDADTIKDFLIGGQVDYPRYVSAVSAINGVTSAQILYDGHTMGPCFISEYWEFNDTEIAEMTLSGGKPSRGEGDTVKYGQIATFKGLKSGVAYGALSRPEGIYPFHVTVYLEGDVDESGRVSGNDALMALQAAVGARELSDLQMHAADMNGDGEIKAVDALYILYAVVGKSAELG